MLSPGDTVAVGVSGGADSVALLSFLCSVKDKFNLSLHVVHINHMIRGQEAERDMEYAKSIAEKFSLPFHFARINVPQKAKESGISEEACGRQVRYDFFSEVINKYGGGKIAVAHHKGDSAETTIINLIRGASLSGLKGISAVNGNVIRPLIECSREDIENYLREKSIPFMTDSTNAENIYTRNIVRNTIIPALSEINPNIISTIYENSLILADDEDYLATVTADYEKSHLETGENSVTVDFSKPVHTAIKRRLILRACQILSGSKRNISAVNINSVLKLSTGGKTYFNGIYVQRNYDKFIFSTAVENNFEFSYSVKPPCILKIIETGRAYSFEITEPENVFKYERNCLYLDADKLKNITIRSRKDGDIFSPLGLGGRKKIKDFLIDLKISRSEREKIPIMESDSSIAGILCLRTDEAFKINKNTKTILKISEVQF